MREKEKVIDSLTTESLIYNMLRMIDLLTLINVDSIVEEQKNANSQKVTQSHVCLLLEYPKK